MSDDTTSNMRYVPALTLGGEATIKQRARNFALYKRLENGDGAGDFKSSGLAGFVFGVPMDSVSIGGSTAPTCSVIRHAPVVKSTASRSAYSAARSRAASSSASHFVSKWSAITCSSRRKQSLSLASRNVMAPGLPSAVLPPMLIENARKALQP